MITIGDLFDIDLDRSQRAIYDRPIGVRPLHQNPVSGSEHYLIRHPAGLTAQRQRHTAAHTIVVPQGRLAGDGEVDGAWRLLPRPSR